MSNLPPLVDKALADAGYDLVDEVSEGWVRARISGDASGEQRLKIVHEGTLLAVQDANVVERIGLIPASDTPAGTAAAGLAQSPQMLLRALRLLKTLVTHPAGRLSAEVEARLARIPATERTREVRQRVGQDVFREALVEFWDDRCALTGIRLPPELLRASHAKPWAEASNAERLDPFNGLLLAVRYDALFDKGQIAFDDDGCLLLSPEIDQPTREFVVLRESMRLRFVLPGHLPYLRYHREHIARGLR